MNQPFMNIPTINRELMFGSMTSKQAEKVKLLELDDWEIVFMSSVSGAVHLYNKNTEGTRRVERGGHRE